MALIDKASLLMVPSTYEDGTLYNVLPSGNKAPDETGNHNGYDQTRADFTFSRGSNLAPTLRIISGLLEKGRENLLLQSNTFDTTWTNVSTTETSGQSGYDGSSNAWKLTKSAASGRIQQGTFSAGVHSFSVYVKADTNNWVQLYLDSTTATDPNCFFDLENGTVGTGTNNIDAAIKSVGDGWYRCSVIGNVGTTFSAMIFPAEADSDKSATSGSIYIQNAQLETGLVATSYLDSGSVSAKAGVLEDMPRINYDANGENGALLLESLRSNLFTHSEYFNTYWSVARATITDKNATSPEGKNNASALVEDNTSNSHPLYRENISVTASASYTASVFVKKGSRDYFRINPTNGGSPVYFNINTGAVHSGTGTIESFANGWYRCSTTWTTTGTNQAVYIEPSLDGSSASYLGNNSTAIFIYGAQLEAGSYPSSYIPTHGSAVSRSAEEYCKVNNIGEFPNEYTLFFEMEDVEASQNNSVIMDLYSTTANTISVRTYETSGDGRLRFVDIVNNSTLFYLEHTSRKYCVRVNGTSVDGFTNGTLVSSATAGSSMNNLDDLNIRCGSSQRSSTQYKQIVAFPTALTDSECISLTS